MKDDKNTCTEQALTPKHLVEASRQTRSLLYNYYYVQEVTMLANEGFAKRLYSLRSAKEVSAREMSLSLGQGNSYITNIENGKHLPSMKQFFSICEYFCITPAEFFDYAEVPDNYAAELYELIQSIDKEDQEILISLANRFRKEKK